ncbi:MAG: polysaccharide biosynthesis protein [Hyphomicrobiales bacterium]|nr:polysaccharide biosynthesis protein [Hyphomicrobiales bacterium]
MIRSFSTYAFQLDRPIKLVILMLADAIALFAAFGIAMSLRLDGLSVMKVSSNWDTIQIAAPLTLIAFFALGLYRVVVRFIAASALRPIFLGVLFASAILYPVAWLFHLFLPRSVPLIFLPIAFLAIAGLRFFVSVVHRQSNYRSKKRVIIYGAGASGRQLYLSLMHGPEYDPIAFVDDATELQGREIGGFTVYSPDFLEKLVLENEIEAVLLAIPSATRAERRAILDRLEPLKVRVQTIPGITDIVSGRASVSAVRNVAIEDLLGRDPVPPDEKLMDANIAGKAVLVTGAGGSIGSELCRQILRQGPTTLVLFELSEFALYSIHQELVDMARTERLAADIVPLLGSVQNGPKLEDALRRYDIATVYHAAAYKHVPMVEHNVVEGVRNNVFGTLAVARAAVAANVSAFILISTDKAVRPTNVMGASKRMAELVCQAFAHSQGGTIFSMVRFGNVLGSSGSVIPLFRRQIEMGGPITVTHREITRYFMLIPEAAQLVIQAGAMARGGDVYVLDMGEPVKIVDLAERMARLSGLTPVVVDSAAEAPTGRRDDIEIVFSKLRPGEKLYEELLIGENAAKTTHPRILTATESSLDWNALAPLIERLRLACEEENIPGIIALFREAPIGFFPDENIVDLLWTKMDGAPRAQGAPLRVADGRSG